MGRFFLIFCLILLALFAAELIPAGQTYVVIPFTTAIAKVSAGLLGLFDDQVLARGKVIWDQDSGFAVSIEAGCNGIEAGIVLIAAMLAFPSPWRYKVLGIALGLLTIQGLNLVRIISLFYLGQWNQTAFEWGHLYVWQALIMLDVLVVFLLWLRWLPSQAAVPGADTPT